MNDDLDNEVDDWRPNRLPSGLCRCDECNTRPPEDPDE